MVTRVRSHLRKTKKGISPVRQHWRKQYSRNVINSLEKMYRQIIQRNPNQKKRLIVAETNIKRLRQLAEEMDYSNYLSDNDLEMIAKETMLSFDLVYNSQECPDITNKIKEKMALIGKGNKLTYNSIKSISELNNIHAIIDFKNTIIKQLKNMNSGNPTAIEIASAERIIELNNNKKRYI